MASKRHAPRRSPTFFRSKPTAIAFFVVVIAILAVGLYLALGMLTRYDYDALLPEDAPLRVKLADGTYVAPTVAPTPTPVVTVRPTTLPTPIPTPGATQVPLAYFCTQNTRMLMPANAPLSCDAELTSMYVSEPDDNKAIVLTGWGYLIGHDAEKTTTYLVVSAKSSNVHRFYEVTTLPGSTGIMHDAKNGENLERADFRVAFKVMTYEEGWYKLGLLLCTRNGRSMAYGYHEFPNENMFYVSSNSVTQRG